MTPSADATAQEVLNQRTKWSHSGPLEGDPRLSDAALRRSFKAKACLIGVMLFFHITPFFLAPIEFPLLNKITDNALFRLNGFHDWFGSVWDGLFVSGRLSKFQICFFVSVLIHQVTYFTWCAPSFVFQFLPFMDSYKVQPSKTPGMATQWRCFRYVFISQLCFQVPFLAFVYVFAMFLNLQFAYDSIPRWYQLGLAILGCSCVEDTWHFWIHWLGHHKKIYKYVHKVHHEHTFPFALTTEYAHPAEQIVLGFGFVIGLLMYSTHICHVWLWMAFRLLESCEVHSGYEFAVFPNPFRLMPWYGGVSFHDFHHENFMGNYSSFYSWWDDICDTNLMYKRKNLCRLLSQEQQGEHQLGKKKSH